MAVSGLPKHLERYTVDQDYSRYTPIDQAAWRHIMRQLKTFLSTNAHACYIDGLSKTGIEVDQIPRIDVMNEKLEKFGWRAVPVSGFIPPAAFMELQSLGVLPIASDMRSIDHLLYTPAPDIVHEAAGHAPILVDPGFAEYLKSYAQVARKAIISYEDMSQYEAIRVLSDMKEDPDSTPEQIKQAELQLATVNAGLKDTSEAAILGRMNWWTAEYGLIGDLKKPKIFGAGLLSSVGESRSAMSDAVKKIPLTIDCIRYSYDITEQQPQLFVVPTFEKLKDVLEELARSMAFRRGGIGSLDKLLRAKTVNTVELDSGLQISGILKSFKNVDGHIAYLSFEGPTQLSHEGKELSGQGVSHHAHGFGSPVGRASVLANGKASSPIDLAALPTSDLAAYGIQIGETICLKYESGVRVEGRIENLTLSPTTGRLLIVTLNQARATHNDEVLFDPAWGVYDMSIGSKVPVVFGGPADREKYGSTEDFTRKLIPRKTYDTETQNLHSLYDRVRKLRERSKQGSEVSQDLLKLSQDISKQAANDWLLNSDLLEIAEDTAAQSATAKSMVADLEFRLSQIAAQDKMAALNISDARKTLHMPS